MIVESPIEFHSKVIPDISESMEDQFPDDLLNELRNKKVIFFTGNGVSRIFSSSGWDKLCQNLVNLCNSKRLFDMSRYQEITKLLDNPVDYPSIIAYCKLLLNYNGFHDRYRETVLSSLSQENQKPIYEKIFGLKPFAVVTTNFEPIPLEYGYTVYPINPTYIYKGNGFFYLHGKISDFENIILDRDAYNAHYHNPQVLQFLSMIFGYPVIFVGYGLKDFEILHILGSVTSNYRQNPIFNLCPTTNSTHEQVKLRNDFLKRDYGIIPIEYSVEYGWESLIDVLGKLYSTVNYKSLKFLEYDQEGIM